MKKTACLILLFLIARPANSQGYDSTVAGWIERVNIDSLASFVRILTGEDSVRIGDSTVLIRRRVGVPGNDLAADYVRQTFEGYGLTAADQYYSSTGRNVCALQPGSVYPDRMFIVCAHYDGVTDYCADDNASGVAAVLEAARILSAEDFPYTIVYAAWDEEELGLIGSSQYAAQAAARGDDIRGVLNLDMLSWDSNSDGMCDVHTGGVGNSRALANLLVSVDSLYGLGLVPVVRDPGTGASDHASFWSEGYSAVLLIEAYYGGDFTPYYHSALDRLDKFNLPYFLDMTKAAVGTISTLAGHGVQVPVTVSLDARWNLVSLPVFVPDGSVGTIYPGAGQAYAYDGAAGYRSEDTLSAGRGYWMRFDSSRSITLTGLPVQSETVAVSSGWNMVGSAAATIDPSTIASVPPGLVTTQFFGYRGGYVVADSIVPGRGYWVKTGGDGSLILAGTGMATQANRITIVATSEIPPPPPDVSTGNPAGGVPAEFSLDQNYPNPFNSSTVIVYSLPATAHVRVSLGTVLGEEIRVLLDEEQPAGRKSMHVDASGLPSGVYWYRLEAGSYSATRKLVLVR